MMVGKRSSICYILSYYSPKYARTETLVGALGRVEEVKLVEARNTASSFVRYFQTLLGLLAARLRHDPQYYILGFRGHEIFWLVRLLSSPARRAL